MKKSIIFKIIFLILITLIFYCFLTFRGIVNDVKYVEDSSFPKYLELFMIKENRIPKGINEILDFIKERDLSLYKEMKDIELEYIKHDKHSFNFYHRGFDGVDNLLKNKYRMNEIGFINSFFKKGDIELNLFFKYKQKANFFYKIGDNNLLENGEFSLLEVYKKYFNCEKIKEKTLDYQGVGSVQLRVGNKGIEVYENSLSDETLKIYLDEIKETKYFKDKDNIYILYIKSYNINIYKCEDN
jgi:hypothetical protein